MPRLKFSVQAHSENPTKTVVQARDFQFFIDEPENLAGTNAGPNPVEYILGALTGCLNVVCHMIAKEMGFTLRGLSIAAEGDLDPAKFMGQTSDGRAGYTEIRVTVTPDADADQATLAKWLQAVEGRCPVSDNIGNATPLRIRLG